MFSPSAIARMMFVGLLLTAAPALAAPGPGAVRLIDAVKAGQVPAVRAALAEPGAVRAREADGTTALHWAVRADNLELTRLLLRAGADANVANRYDVTPLSLAATNGNAAIAGALLDAGADPNGASREGQTVLMVAARSGNVQAVRRLLDAGADPNAAERWLGETALMWAAAHDHAAAVDALVEYGADADARSALSTIPVLQAAGIGIITMEFPKGGWTALMYAAREGALDATRALARAGARLDAAGPDGVTPLILAIINAQYDVAAALLEAGANPNCADQSGMTALYAAVDMHTPVWMQGRPDARPSGALDEVDLVKALLARGARVDAALTAPLLQRNHTAGDGGLGAGATPLMRAAKSGDGDLIRLLLDAGADPKKTLANHTTAVMLAAGMTWRDGGGAFPTRDRATDERTLDTLGLLLAHGVDINAVNDAGETALHGSVQRGSPAIIRYLAAHGAKLDARNKQGRTPLDAALNRRERGPAVEALRQLGGQGSAPAEGGAASAGGTP
jgi:ankyrin repeat protein